jgi:hypothetical protein
MLFIDFDLKSQSGLILLFFGSEIVVGFEDSKRVWGEIGG